MPVPVPEGHQNKPIHRIETLHKISNPHVHQISLIMPILLKIITIHSRIRNEMLGITSYLRYIQED